MNMFETLKAPTAPLAAFLGALRADRARLLDLGNPLSICLAFARDDALIADSPVRAALALLSQDMRDYAISSAYALLIGPTRRKSLSAYFTPPSLAWATIEAARPFFERHGATVLDPACGGGSFLVPTARAMILHGIASGEGLQNAATNAVARINGIELDAGLASLSATLLADALRQDFSVTIDTDNVVDSANALEVTRDDRFDLIIGNPPYSKVWAKGAAAISAIAGKANLGGHTNLYALFILRALEWLKPGGGLAFVLPTSFIAGPYFKGLREEILARANVVRIDMHQQREHLFIDAIQDVCLLVLQRHGGECAPTDCYALGVIDANGARTALGTASTPPNGEAWLVPVAGGPQSEAGHFKLTTSKPADVISSYGYRLRVGKVVPKRERSHLFSEPAPGRLPVLWASDVRADGVFKFQGGTRTALSAWYLPPPTGGLSYVSRGRAVIVQRTANRDQKRRLNASAVSEAFAAEHAEHGYVAENHVIVIEPAMTEPLVPPDTLAALLNSAIVSERFSAVAGSFSVSAKLLARLALPPAADLPAMGPAFERELAGCFAGLDGILAGVAAPQ
jgi:adenine-specific DNA-methyltransferase